MPPKKRRGLAQEVLRTHTTAHWIFVLKQHRTIANLLFALSAVMPTTAWCIWLNKCCKTAQDARTFCFWPFFNPLPTAWLIFTPKVSTGRSPIFILAIFRSSTTAWLVFTPKGSTGRSPICIGPLSGFCRPHGSFLPRKGAQDYGQF